MVVVLAAALLGGAVAVDRYGTEGLQIPANHPAGVAAACDTRVVAVAAMEWAPIAEEGALAPPHTEAGIGGAEGGVEEVEATRATHHHPRWSSSLAAPPSEAEAGKEAPFEMAIVMRRRGTAVVALGTVEEASMGGGVAAVEWTGVRSMGAGVERGALVENGVVAEVPTAASGMIADPAPR